MPARAARGSAGSERRERALIGVERVLIPTLSEELVTELKLHLARHGLRERRARRSRTTRPRPWPPSRPRGYRCAWTLQTSQACETGRARSRIGPRRDGAAKDTVPMPTLRNAKFPVEALQNLGCGAVAARTSRRAVARVSACSARSGRRRTSRRREESASRGCSCRARSPRS